MFKRKWKLNQTQKKEYAERMQGIEAAKAEPIPPEYSINCTGDCVTDDEIYFFNPGKTSERLKGVIISESYGKQKQQHTFSIETAEHGRLLIKGRNLYKNGVYRKPWPDESKRALIAAAKHERGDKARTARQQRKDSKE